jgi:hypothetical protein
MTEEEGRQAEPPLNDLTPEQLRERLKKRREELLAGNPEARREIEELKRRLEERKRELGPE